jgi:hypothetical protein
VSSTCDGYRVRIRRAAAFDGRIAAPGKATQRERAAGADGLDAWLILQSLFDIDERAVAGGGIGVAR